MSLDDLDLEFEDEEAEKKSDAVSVDVDLEFGTDTTTGISKHSPGASPKPVSKPAITSKQPTAPTTAPNRPAIVAKTPPTESNVRPITPKASAPSASSTPSSVGSSALKVEAQIETTHSSEDQENLVTQLKGRIEQVEMDAQIKIAVAEFKTDILSDLLSDIKLLEHQVGGLLGRIHTKHPDLKQEVLMIKKLLSEFSNKKRK